MRNGSIYSWFMFHLALLQSESNVQQLLISDVSVGLTSYGLTEDGKKQAKEVLTV